jgi:hypothetical protein
MTVPNGENLVNGVQVNGVQANGVHVNGVHKGAGFDSIEDTVEAFSELYELSPLSTLKSTPIRFGRGSCQLSRSFLLSNEPIAN